ncbi:MAG: glycosyltransferase, partial [Alphaproteobacteria bacterium]|nr:glycosyltransferase [Alphaproteobacteria bacterium]
KEIEKIVLEYASRDKRIKHSKNDKNLGITPSRNKLLKMARGEYLAIFDHDDISVPTRLEQEVAYLDANPDVGVVSGWLQHFGEQNEIVKKPEYDVDIKIFLTENCYVAHTAAMIRKSVLIDNDIEYEAFYSPAEDYRLWTRLMMITHFYNIQDVLVKYRTFLEQTTNKQRDKMKAMHRAIQLDIINHFPEYRKAFERQGKSTNFRLRLFGKIPLLKIKNNWVYLFEFIPVFKIRWK